MREYTLMELIDTAAKFQQKARASVQACLGGLWDMGRRGMTAFSDLEENRENGQCHHTACMVQQGKGFKVLILL